MYKLQAISPFLHVSDAGKKKEQRKNSVSLYIIQQVDSYSVSGLISPRISHKKLKFSVLFTQLTVIPWHCGLAYMVSGCMSFRQDFMSFKALLFHSVKQRIEKMNERKTFFPLVKNGSPLLPVFFLVFIQKYFK